LYSLLDQFDRDNVQRKNWDAYSEKFSPEVVMKAFEDNVIESALKNKNIPPLIACDKLHILFSKLCYKSNKLLKKAAW
jgi:hypothetical protein